MSSAAKQPWQVMPISAVGKKNETAVLAIETMLGEMGLVAPSPPKPTGVDFQPPPAEHSLTRLPIETNPFPPAPDMTELFDKPTSASGLRQEWFASIEGALMPDTSVEMEIATDRSGGRRNSRRGIFWLVSGDERVVNVWDGSRVQQTQAVLMEDGGSLVFDPDSDNLFVVSDAEERLYVFTVGRKRPGQG
ncbi:MAG: hypothetical protein K8R90_09770 [Candidatus Cloacimonetes bacterium]|nr:hypothetical protein [Candidatus Cloacimonadota bacterium]